MGILDQIRKALRSADASISDLREALDAIDLEALQAEVDRAQRVRAGLLLDGTEAALDKAEAALTIAIRERDRGIAAKAELEKRIAEVAQAAAVEALTAERNKVEGEANAVANDLKKRLVGLQTEIVGILGRLHDAEKAVEQINGKLIEAGRDDLIPAVETRAFPAPAGYYAPVFSILKNEIRPVAGAPGWGAALPRA
ncbi:hypothetical protein [Rhizobium grahamii]|uniref:Uncharacterized protein n=1 Tax=Rhizobium grahamii CCGE 502 TaxID=990285 RepID=S3HHY4_9HYPH|nr:hypothetical protein [Rhizobium grahamii]EPE98437.1 hypothetical protein RGCCGE502_08420 [Rhizobium grahamii CCGE 502]